MPPIPSRGSARLLQLIRKLHVRNYDIPPRTFVPEKSFLEKFNKELLEEVLADLYPDNKRDVNVGNDDHIYHSLRKTIAILCKIGHGSLVYEFCKHLDLQDKYLPFNTSAFVPLKDEFECKEDFDDFVNSFCTGQLEFLAIPLEKMGRSIIFNEQRIVPIVSQTPITKGGFAFVSKIKIHEEYDRLAGEAEKNVYAMKRLISYENANDKQSREEQDKIFRSEVDTHYQLSRLVGESGHIIPLLAAFQQHERYMMIFPLAEQNLSEYFNRTPQPESDEDIMEILKQVRGIISALESIHYYCKQSAAEEMQDQAADSEGGTRKIAVHRDLSPKNILVRHGTWMISDFGHAKVHTLKEGEVSGKPSMSATSTYQAPECRFDVDGKPLNSGRPADVWSLACILSEVFSFMILGKEGLDDFIETRKSDGKGRDSFHSDLRIKDSVTDWLDGLKDRAPDHRRILVSGVVDLLGNMFQSDPQDRPKMWEVRRRYYEIISKAEYPPLFLSRSESKLELDLDRLAVARENTHGAGLKAERRVPQLRTYKETKEFIQRLLNPFPKLRDAFSSTSVSTTDPAQAQNAQIGLTAETARPAVLLAREPSTKSLPPNSVRPAVALARETSTKSLPSNSVRPAAVFPPQPSTKSSPSNSMQFTHATAAIQPAQRISEGTATSSATSSATSTTPTRYRPSQMEPTSALSPPRTFGDMSNGPVKSLKDHETVFLVDDSIPLDSNSNTRVHMGQILINLAHAGAQVDHDGIDLHFARNVDCDRFKVNSWETVMEAFISAEPIGRESMSRVDEILSKYIARFKKHRDGQRFERLNLIVLTDGETENWEFLELRLKIKGYMEELDSLGAPQNLMGVQFVLVGEDSPNKERFKELDNLHKVYNMRLRDIVDVTPLSGDPAKMETKQFEEVFNKSLCGGVIKVWDEFSPGTGLGITKP